MDFAGRRSRPRTFSAWYRTVVYGETAENQPFRGRQASPRPAVQTNKPPVVEPEVRPRDYEEVTGWAQKVEAAAALYAPGAKDVRPAPVETVFQQPETGSGGAMEVERRMIDDRSAVRGQSPSVVRSEQVMSLGPAVEPADAIVPASAGGYLVGATEIRCSRGFPA